MIKIATVLMTTSVFAGLLIAGPSLTMASNPVAAVAAVKVKTIPIRLPAAAPVRVTNPADVADLLDPNPHYLPAALGATPSDELPHA